MDLLKWFRAKPEPELVKPKWKPGPDWRSWMLTPPPPFDMIEIRHPDWSMSSIVAPMERSPASNIYNVYWRPWAGDTIDNGAKILEYHGPGEG